MKTHGNDKPVWIVVTIPKETCKALEVSWHMLKAFAPCQFLRMLVSHLVLPKSYSQGRVRSGGLHLFPGGFLHEVT